MSNDIKTWVLECDVCQSVVKPLVAGRSLQSIKVSAVWEFVGLDISGRLPQTAQGNQYIVSLTDYFSKWVEGFAMKTKSASEVSACICQVIYRHGCPKRILTGQGEDFANELNEGICSILRIKRSYVAASHPRTKMLCQQTNRTILRALGKIVNEKQNDWDVFLNGTLFSLRSKMHSTTKCSPFLLMYGREAVYPSELTADTPVSLNIYILRYCDVYPSCC
uniref:Integrase catalytic domain-containing protein n=1 Tax=Leptobrachium leishanense TaxID=445787 RepID=A0A8C5QRN9_9ANUR